jgi:hypothetical protein
LFGEVEDARYSIYEGNIKYRWRNESSSQSRYTLWTKRIFLW